MGLFSLLFGGGLSVKEMSEHLAKVEHGALLSSQQKKKCVQLIQDAQGGIIDRSKVKITLAELSIEGLLGQGLDNELIVNNIHLVHGSVMRILAGIDKEIDEEISKQEQLRGELIDSMIEIESCFTSHPRTMREYANNTLDGIIDRSKLKEKIAEHIVQELLNRGVDNLIVKRNYCCVLDFAKVIAVEIDKVIDRVEEANNFIESSELVAVKRLWDWADEHNISKDNIPRDKDGLLNLEKLSFMDIERPLEEGFSLLPKEISILRKLKFLELGSAIHCEYVLNHLSELPEAIGELSELTHIHLQQSNNLSELPACIGNLSKLKVLKLGGNNLSRLPKEIGNLEKLEVLTIWGNQLVEITKEIGFLKNLKGLDISRNNLTELPNEITNLTELKIFLYDDDKVQLSEEQKEWVTMLKNNGCELI